MTTQRIQITELYKGTSDQGTSDQHPARRIPDQVEVAENVRFDIARGFYE